MTLNYQKLPSITFTRWNLPFPKPQFAESGGSFLARLAVGLQTRLQRINLVAHKPMRRSVGRDVTRQEWSASPPQKGDNISGKRLRKEMPVPTRTFHKKKDLVA